MTPRVVLGVGGGIAAYKACELLRLLREAGNEVRVVPTQAALQFVGRATWEALAGHPVSTVVWDDVHLVPHVSIGQQADLVVVAPATADLLARAASGRADDLLTSTLLATRAPVVFAPAMHTEMWEHPATVANVATLRSRGAVVIDPAVGRLTGADSGAGRLPEPESLLGVCRAVLDRGAVAADLVGRNVLISAGGTREPIDPVRYIGNHSSGRQAWALASAAAARGANVTVIAANVRAPSPAGATVHHVGTAAELRDEMVTRASTADIVIMAAAVADFRPVDESATKIKKGDSGSVPAPVALERTADVLAELGASRHGDEPFLVGFAAETASNPQELVDLAAKKLVNKGADLLVANEVGPGKGFESRDNKVVLVDASGVVGSTELTSKEAVANAVLDVVSSRLRGAVGQA
ncbi:MAG: bifunctional phosphopantothenoylcysteine decarboxylase/phosphopantothenate--cysteine ligase CoaBC [Candidatus Nanopelagicales bacterium]